MKRWLRPIYPVRRQWPRSAIILGVHDMTVSRAVRECEGTEQEM